MKRKLARLYTWRDRSRRTSDPEFIDTDDDDPLTVVCAPEHARTILTGSEPNTTKGEFQKSPFCALLGAEWLAYLDGPIHIELRRHVLQLLRHTRERNDWHDYRTKLTVVLRRLIETGGANDIFDTLATFSSWRVGRALFGEAYTGEINRQVRIAWESMNRIAEQNAQQIDSCAMLEFNGLALGLRATLNAILPPQSDLKIEPFHLA